MVSNVCGYSRLKGVFRSAASYNDYSRIVETAKTHVVGNLPNEMIKSIKSVAPDNIGNQVKQIQGGFADATEILRGFDTIHQEKIENFKLPKDIIHNFINAKLAKDNDELKLVKNQARELFVPTHKELKSICNKASQSLKKSMAKILPKNSTVKTTYIGSGAFGNGFKIEFLDKNGNKIFSDRVLKVYKLKGTTNKQIMSETQLWLNSISLQPDKVFSKITNKKKMTDKVAAKEVSKQIVKKLKAELNSAKKKLEKFFAKNGENKSPHGVVAEANLVTFLKRAAGHSLNKTDLINANMFDLKNGYCISSDAYDETLPKITSKFHFEKIGLRHGDIDKNKANIVAGRIVDFGGILNIKKVLEDHTVLKYYKKIMNRENPQERKAVLIRLTELAANPKTPHADKIQKAIKRANWDIAHDITFKRSPKDPNFSAFLDKLKYLRTDDMINIHGKHKAIKKK